MRAGSSGAGPTGTRSHGAGEIASPRADTGAALVFVDGWKVEEMGGGQGAATASEHQVRPDSAGVRAAGADGSDAGGSGRPWTRGVGAADGAVMSSEHQARAGKRDPGAARTRTTGTSRASPGLAASGFGRGPGRKAGATAGVAALRTRTWADVVAAPRVGAKAGVARAGALAVDVKSSVHVVRADSGAGERRAVGRVRSRAAGRRGIVGVRIDRGWSGRMLFLPE
nr:hypothetical protein GCM10020063_072060 [Dactylosporangium thailandense]